MLERLSKTQTLSKARYHVSLAVDDGEIREAQRLRYAVFVEEMGACLPTVLPGHDIDLYDPYCDHLLVRELAAGEVVGTYRILTPESAQTRWQLLRRTGVRPHPVAFPAPADG